MSSKLREAVNQLLGLIDNEILVFNTELDPSEVSNAQYQIDKANEALEEPLLNCEVGTVDEQYKRQYKWCRKHNVDGDMEADCANPDNCCELCTLRWSKMPYEKDE